MDTPIQPKSFSAKLFKAVVLPVLPISSTSPPPWPANTSAIWKHHSSQALTPQQPQPPPNRSRVKNTTVNMQLRAGYLGHRRPKAARRYRHAARYVARYHAPMVCRRQYERMASRIPPALSQSNARPRPRQPPYRPHCRRFRPRLTRFQNPLPLR